MFCTTAPQSSTLCQCHSVFVPKTYGKNNLSVIDRVIELGGYTFEEALKFFSVNYHFSRLLMSVLNQDLSREDLERLYDEFKKED